MFELENSKFFKTLPEDTKQKIRESGRKFYSESGLRDYVLNIEGLDH